MRMIRKEERTHQWKGKIRESEIHLIASLEWGKEEREQEPLDQLHKEDTSLTRREKASHGRLKRHKAHFANLMSMCDGRYWSIDSGGLLLTFILSTRSVVLLLCWEIEIYNLVPTSNLYKKLEHTFRLKFSLCSIMYQIQRKIRLINTSRRCFVQ